MPRRTSRAERDELFFKIMLKSPSFVLDFLFFGLFCYTDNHPLYQHIINIRRRVLYKIILWYRIYNWIRVYAYPKSVYYLELFCILYSVLKYHRSLFSFFISNFLLNSMCFHNANKMISNNIWKSDFLLQSDIKRLIKK